MKLPSNLSQCTYFSFFSTESAYDLCFMLSRGSSSWTFFVFYFFAIPRCPQSNSATEAKVILRYPPSVDPVIRASCYREDSIHPKLTLIGRHHTKFSPLGLIFFLSSLGHVSTEVTWKVLILLKLKSRTKK